MALIAHICTKAYLIFSAVLGVNVRLFCSLHACYLCWTAGCFSTDGSALFFLAMSTFPPLFLCPLLFACACPPLLAEIAQLSPDQVMRMSILGTEFWLFWSFFAVCLCWLLVVFCSFLCAFTSVSLFLSILFKPFKCSLSLSHQISRSNT